MTRSVYTTISPLTVPCSSCFASVGERCIRKVKIARFTFRDVPRKTVHSARRKAADDKRTLEVHAQANPFFTPSAKPIPPEYYHNVPGRDGIFTINMKADAFQAGIKEAHEALVKLRESIGEPQPSLLPPHTRAIAVPRSGPESG